MPFFDFPFFLSPTSNVKYEVAVTRALAKFWTPGLITNVKMCSYPQIRVPPVIRLDVTHERFCQNLGENF
jgi:hypothetical protein